MTRRRRRRRRRMHWEEEENLKEEENVDTMIGMQTVTHWKLRVGPGAKT